MSFIQRLKPKPQAIGVEVGTSSIKVVSLKPGQPPLLEHAVMTPTPPGSTRDGMVVEPQRVADALRGLLQQHGISAKHAVTAIPNQQAVTRNIVVPRLPQKELATAIPFEAERYIPYPIAEVSLDFAPLDDPATLPEGTDQMEVVIAAAPNEVVAQQVQILQLADLQPTVIDLKAFATLRALRSNLLSENLTQEVLPGNVPQLHEVVLVVEIGASNTLITLVRGERLLMTRSINVAADDFTTALQQGFDLDFNAAEEVKLNYALTSGGQTTQLDKTREQYSPARVSEVLRPTLSELVTEIRRSVEFYRVQAGDIVIERILLAGGGAKLRGLPSAINEALGLRVAVANPWLSVQTEQSGVDTGFLQAYGPEFAVPLGLALRGVNHG